MPSAQVARRAMGVDQVAEATEAALKCTYHILGNQQGRLRNLSVKCPGSPSLPALRALAQQHLGVGAVAIRVEVPWLAHLLTMPGCRRQRRHKGHLNPRVWSIIVALGLNARVVMFRNGNREIPIRIAPGDVVIFRGMSATSEARRRRCAPPTGPAFSSSPHMTSPAVKGTRKPAHARVGAGN
jgi:hypothetical protein